MSTSQTTLDPSYLTAKNNRSLPGVPGRYGWPLVGRNLELLADPLKFLEDQHKEYGDVAKSNIARCRCVTVYGPEHAKNIILDADRTFSVKRGWEILIPEFFKGGLLHKDYDDHRVQRRIMQTAFKSNSLRNYTEVIIKEVGEHIQRWSQKNDIILFTEIKQLLLDIAFKVFCAVDDNDNDRKQVNQAFTEMMEGAAAMAQFDIPGTAFHKGLKARKFLEDYFRSKIEMKRQSNETDAFTFFCKETKENGEYFSDDEIADHVVFLMLAAHDTTASTFSMACYYLAHDKEVQTRFAEESKTLGDNISFDTMKTALPYAEAVFKETLRLHPAVPMFFRRTTQDSLIDGFLVPANTMIMVPTIYNQRLPEFWPEPTVFKPSRFEPENIDKTQHSFAWYPFGGGAHKCIGLNFADILFKATMHELLRNYEIDFTNEGYYPADIQMFPFSKPQNGLPLKLTQRG